MARIMAFLGVIAAAWVPAGADEVALPSLQVVKVIEVTDGAREYWPPVWSPDGAMLAFADRSSRQTYVKNADGTGPLREIPRSDTTRCLLTWTHDSRGLLCEVRTASLGRCLGRIDVETEEVVPLAGPLASWDAIRRNSYGDVTFTVRKKMEALNYRTGEMDKTPYDEIKVIDSRTGAIMNTYDYYSPERPESGEVRLDRDNGAKMWVVEGSGARRTEFPHRALLATLSPTRDKVIFIPGDGNMYVSALDGSSMVNLGRGGSWAWSPDGKRLAYIGATKEDGYNVIAAELFVVNADGTGATQLTHTADVVEGDPVWSPDGLKIAYSAWNTQKIYVAVLGEVR